MVDTLDKPFHVNADTWIDKGDRSQTHGNGAALSMNDSTPDKRYALVHISVPGLPGATVHNATLTVYLRGTGWAGTDNIFVDLLDVRFTEKDTWHSYQADLPTIGPGATSPNVGSGGADGTRVDIDVTSLLQDAADADKFFGLLLSTNTSGNHNLYASESAKKHKRPFLTIKYSLAPGPPTNQRPANFASAQKPRLAWDCVPQTEFRVQLSETASPGALDGESGWIVSDVQETDTNDDGAWDTPFATNLPGNGDVMSWRVQIKDEVGTMSDWSPWVEWTRRTFSALVLTEPDPGDQVLTTTPEITWTFAGTETMWQVLIDELDYSSGRIPGVDLAHTLPRGTLLQRNETYNLRLRVWDPYLRDAPGDASYVEATATFFYDGDGGETAPDSFVATPDGPAIELTWHRAAAPDAFTILADEDIIVDQLDAGDHATGGGSYSYRLLRAGTGPVRDTTYSVVSHSNVNGDSLSSNTATGLTGPQGIWLVYEDEGIEVEFFGQPEVALKITDDGSTYFPLGSRAPIRIVDQIRGYEGSVQGLLIGDAAHDDMLAIKAVPPGTKGDNGLGVLRLIFGRYNFPVDLGQVDISQWPMAEGDNAFSVTVEFFQTDRPWPVQ